MSKTRKRSPAASRKVGKRAKAAGYRGAKAFLPAKLGKRRQIVEKKKTDGSGPIEWLQLMLESTYTPLNYAEAQKPVAATTAMSSIQSGSKAALGRARSTVWRDVFLQYKRRKAAAVAAPRLRPAVAGAPPAPFIPGANNWLPLGPSVVMHGQTVGNQPVAGRVSRIAVAPNGAVVYAASANGGVFRSADGGTTWRAMMDRFDLNPTSFASASLVCGAIALDPADVNRVYVGTGEGDTLQLFRARVTSALPAYRGVGMLRSDDGGENWVSEPSSPELAGEAFFALAVDPRDRENVVAATTAGLYHRVAQPGGQFQWTQVRTGVFASVVVAATTTATRFYCAQWGQNGGASNVLHSDDGGTNWNPTGTDFPTGDVGRIALGLQTDNPDRVYAFVTTGSGKLQGVYRLDGVQQKWKRVSAVPDVLPGGQGSYDLTIAVDPHDANLIYLGGDRMNTPPWGGSVWRCAIVPKGAAFKVKSSASIGTHSHADVHMICHTPGESN